MKTETVAVLGIGAVLVAYLLTRPKTVTPTYTAPIYPGTTTNPYQQYGLPSSTNGTAQIITASGSALSSLSDSLSSLFG